MSIRPEILTSRGITWRFSMPDTANAVEIEIAIALESCCLTLVPTDNQTRQQES